VRLPADLYREARILALERGITFQELVESLLSKELEKSDSASQMTPALLLRRGKARLKSHD
jgi:hypothetical protein